VQLESNLTAAFLRLRAHAYLTGRRLSQVAGDVVGHRLRLHQISTPRAQPGPATEGSEMGRKQKMLDQRITETLVELADTLVLGFDGIDFLHTLTERCVQLLGVDAAGILLVDQRGTLNLVAASTEQTRLLELFQLQNEEGPCLDCYHSGQSVACTDLAALPQRWPRFAAAAHEQGFAAVQAVPMRLREQILGALNLFRRTPSAIPADVTAVAQSFANVATISVLQLRALRHSEIVTEQLQGALNSRILIEQAKGILAERRHLSIADAFTLMRSYARKHNRLLSQVAQAVITQESDITDLTNVASPTTVTTHPQA
jgi:GAF domain-containing protein